MATARAVVCVDAGDDAELVALSLQQEPMDLKTYVAAAEAEKGETAG